MARLESRQLLLPDISFVKDEMTRKAFEDVKKALEEINRAVYGDLGSQGLDFAVPTVTLGTAHAEGSATTGVRSDATILAYDATAPVTQAIGDTAAAGSAAVAAKRDHTHGMPAFAAPTVTLGLAHAEGAATTLLRTDATILAFDDGNTPIVASAAANGTNATASRDDHVHPAEPIPAEQIGYVFDTSVSQLSTTTGYAVIPLHAAGLDTISFYKHADHDVLNIRVSTSGGDSLSRLKIDIDASLASAEGTINGNVWTEIAAAMDISSLGDGWHTLTFSAKQASGGAQTVILIAAAFRLS